MVRVVRVGQEKPVTIYHLVTSGSQEEKRIISNQRKERISKFMIKEQCVLESEVDKKLRKVRAPTAFNFAIDCSEDVDEILTTAMHDCDEYEKIFSQSLKGIIPKPQPPTVPRAPRTAPRTPPTLPQPSKTNSPTPPPSQLRSAQSSSLSQPGSPPPPPPSHSQPASNKKRMPKKK